MTLPILFLVLTQFNPFTSSPIQSGVASQYGKGVMSQVIQYRQSHSQIPLDLSPYSGFLAVLEADDIGNEFWVRPAGSPVWEKFLAVDCAGISDGGYSWMVNSGIIVEVDYNSAERWGTVGKGIEIEMIEISNQD